MSEAKPWDVAFRRIRSGYRTDWLYPPKPSASDLDAAESLLGCRFPASYRAFATEFGLDGRLEVLPEVLSLTTPQWREKSWEWDSVIRATQYIQSDQWAQHLTQFGEPATPLDFFRRVVVFAIDGGYHTFVFNLDEVTDVERHEYRIYDINRSDETTAIADSFGGWLDWVHEHYKFDREEPEESVPDWKFVYKPDSADPNPTEYSRNSLRRNKETPATNDVVVWLTFNNGTARDIALSIRDEGRADAFPILADALQDTGCAHADLLDACRTGDPDIDGQWVLQVLLGK